MLYPFYPSTLPRPEGGVECRTKAVQKVENSDEQRRHATRHRKSVIHTRAAGVRHLRVEWRARFRALRTARVIFMFFKFLNFRVSTPILYLSTLLYPSKS